MEQLSLLSRPPISSGILDTGAHMSSSETNRTRYPSYHHTRPSISAFLAFLAVLMSSSGCGNDDRSTVSAPTFNRTNCWESVLAADRTATCGFVGVPEDRRNPRGRQIQIAVARLHARNPGDHAPLIFLEGGPGVSSLQLRPGGLADVFLDRQDLILFDQRGVGFSVPALNCPEREEALWAIFNHTGDLGAEVDAMNAASLACIARFRADGVQLEKYDTIENARDVADIRKALEIPEWDIYGASYGTTLALEVMRSHPQGVRSAVLDATSPPNRGVTVDRVAESGARAFSVLAAGCDHDPACANLVGGDLQSLLETVRDQLDAHPMPLVVTDAQTGGKRPVLIDGSDLVAGLFNALYSTSLIPVIPSLLVQISQRNRAVVQAAAETGINDRIIFYDATFLAVECRDRGRFWPPNEVSTFLDEHPDMVSLYNFFAIPACADLDLGFVDSSFNDPITSDIPTLIFGGEYDPITPPEWGAETAEQLSNATFFLLPGVGHGAVPAHPCPEQIMRDFLADPTSPPIGACIDDMGEFVLQQPLKNRTALQMVL